MKKASKSMLNNILLLLVAAISYGNSNEDDARIDAFYRCIASLDLPNFINRDPACNRDPSIEDHVQSACKDLSIFADYIESNSLTREQISFDLIIPNDTSNSTHNISLWETTLDCVVTITDDQYEYYYNFFDYDEVVLQPQQVYSIEACHMSELRNRSFTSSETLNFVLYTYFTIVELYFSPYYIDTITRSAITEGYLNTCTSYAFVDDATTCVNYLLESCFEFEIYFDPYYCFNETILEFCEQFGGDERFKCIVILEEKSLSQLEGACSNNANEAKCENILSSVLQKPIMNLNSTDINQLRSVLIGGIQNMNHTLRSLQQLNDIVGYFNQNETQVAMQVDNNDMSEFYQVIDTLLNADRINMLTTNDSMENNTVGHDVLNDIDEISRVLSLSILNQNHRISGDYQYNGSNTKFKFDLARKDRNYNSGDLSLRGLNSTLNMSASIEIPRSDLCDNIDYDDYDHNDYIDYYYYNYGNPCGDEFDADEECILNDGNYDYYYYDLSEIFGTCSKVLSITQDCQTVVTTSVAQNIPELLSSRLPQNMSFASLVMTSSIMKMNNDDRQTSLSDTATLHFTLTDQMEQSDSVPKCHFFNMDTREWSDEGVTTVYTPGQTEVTCTSNHLTSFAVLVDHQGLINEISEEERLALSIVGYIGPSLSIVCLIISIILMIIFRKEMKKGILGYIHLNLSIALLLSLIILVGGLELSKDIRWLCGLIAGLLQYFLLCVFCWMLIEGIVLFSLVVYVWTKLNKWYLFLPIGWGIPLVITGISVGIKYKSYGINRVCWLPGDDGLIWSFLGPAVAICIINTVVLVITVVKLVNVVKKKNQNSKFKTIGNVKSTLAAIMILSPLLGITWIIGVFAIDKRTSVFLWLFTIFNSFQGVAILVFHVLQNKAISSKILRKKQKKLNSSTVQSSVKWSSQNSNSSLLAMQSQDGGDSGLTPTTIDVLPTIMDDDESPTNKNMDQFESPPVV